MTDHLRVLERMRHQRRLLLQAVDWNHAKGRWTEVEKAAARFMYKTEIQALDAAIVALGGTSDAVLLVPDDGGEAVPWPGA